MEVQKSEVSGFNPVKNVRALNKYFKKRGIDQVRPVFNAPSEQYVLVAMLADRMGIPLHFVSNNPIFDGVAFNGVSYIAESMQYSPLAIAGHELEHVLEQINPRLAKKLRESISQYLREEALENRLMQERYSDSSFTKKKALGEVLADINGAMWMDGTFWLLMYAADSNILRRETFRIMASFANSAFPFPESRFDASIYVTDVATVRKIIVDIWTEHNQSRT